jgi:hypothetical protein
MENLSSSSLRRKVWQVVTIFLLAAGFFAAFELGPPAMRSFLAGNIKNQIVVDSTVCF